ncbi:MAG: TIGR04063 family PEP-CTERM/XrtA system glycosyltransferase [Gammaproteobacteria bacterium]
MKVLHVFDHSVPIQDGYAYRSLNILRAQAALGWQTRQLTSIKQGERPALCETFEGMRFERTPLPKAAWARLPLADQAAVVTSLGARLDELIERERPDVLHAHSPPLVGLAAVRAGRRHRLPVVYEIRAFWEDAAVDKGACREGDLRYRLTRALETHVVTHADAVTCICAGLRGDLLARGLPEDKVTVIPNAVEPEQFSLDEAYDETLAASLGLARGATLGFVGSFYAYEGLRLLISALPTVIAARPDARLLLVGGGNDEAALRADVAALGLHGQVVFTGRVPHDEVERYYNLIDVLVYPRLAMRLTELVTPLKPLEAMVQQRLVVASDVGGHRELIEDGETGLLFTAGSAEDLARAVLRLLGDEALAARLRRNGRVFVENERTWARSVARYPAVYERALARARR